MDDKPIREPDQIRGDCARKLEPVEISPMFRAGDASFKSTFLTAEADLIRNIHGVAAVAELDGDEVGYLVGKVAEIKGIA